MGQRKDGAHLSRRSGFLWGLFFLLLGGISLFEDLELRLLRLLWPLLIMTFVLVMWSGWMDNRQT